MNFNKIKSSEKFDYMMLSRLIQDAKYFIEHPDLKHLWARTLDKHIKQMKEQYAKLYPKPEWTSLEEIENLAQQMKEAYKNHWNEVHPDNKIKSSEQPTTPKPTEVLPTNMQWAWEPKANTWIAVMKDNPVVTPPTYNPNNIQNQSTTSYMSTVKSELRDNGNISDYLALDDGTGTIILVNDKNENFEILLKHRDLDNKVIIKELINKDDLFNGIDKVDFTKKYNTFKNDLSKVNISIDDLKHYSDQVNKDLKETLLNKKQSSCLTKFLDGPQYSKEIKIEAGLIKEGLVKYAGFDFNRGTKYAITNKGLEVLRKASEQEHNEALNEREKLAYMFGFNTEEVSTLDTTGKVIESEEDSEYLDEPFYTSTKPSKKIDTLEELHDYIVGAETVYFSNKPRGISIKNTPEKMEKLKMLKEDIYRAKEILNKYNYGKVKNYKKFSSKKWTICEADGTELGEVEAENELDAKVKFGIEHPEYVDSLSISVKEVKANINEKSDFLPLVSDYSKFLDILTSKTNIKREDAYDKYGNYTYKQWNELLNNLGIKIDAKYEETTESHEPYPNPSETPHDDIVLENHDGWVNTAGLKNKSVYRKLFILAKMLEDYRKKELIRPAESEDDNVEIITGDAKTINELEHKIKDLGFYCESVLQSELPETGLIYSLKIFLDEE